MLVVGGILFIAWAVWDGFYAAYPIMPRRVLNRTFVSTTLCLAYPASANATARLRLNRLLLFLLELPRRFVLFVMDLGDC